MLKSPVINPLLVLIVHRAISRSASPLSLERGWLACPGWMPADERQAETQPLECLSEFTALARTQLEAAISSEMFRIATGQLPSPIHHLSPLDVAHMLYGKVESHVDFSSVPDRACSPALAIGKTWEETFSDASWIIRSRPEISAWIELDPGETIDEGLPGFCLRMGSGLWFHPPNKKLSGLDGCRGLGSALDAMLATPGWDQWVFPLSEALEIAIAQRMSNGGDMKWLSVPRAAKWPDLPDWVWKRADNAYGGSFGVIIAAIAARLVSGGLVKVP